MRMINGIQVRQNPAIAFGIYLKLENPDTYTRCLNKLKSEFDKDNIGIVANRLGIAGKTVDLSRFSSAILNQLMDFSDNKGDCENNCPHYYQGNVVNNDFQEYFNWARERYGVLKLLGGAEVQLKDFYVCNIIGKHRYKYGDNIKRTGVYIEDATLSKIRDLYIDKGVTTLKAKIIGCGGGNRAEKKKTVIEKIKAFFEKFYGIGGNDKFSQIMNNIFGA